MLKRLAAKKVPMPLPVNSLIIKLSIALKKYICTYYFRLNDIYEYDYVDLSKMNKMLSLILFKQNSDLNS